MERKFLDKTFLNTKNGMRLLHDCLQILSAMDTQYCKNFEIKNNFVQIYILFSKHEYAAALELFNYCKCKCTYISSKIYQSVCTLFWTNSTVYTIKLLSHPRQIPRFLLGMLCQVWITLGYTTKVNSTWSMPNKVNFEIGVN